MKIRYLNNDGGGFADEVDVVDGTTVGEFVTEQLRGKSPSNFLIRVNRDEATSNQVLQDLDRVTVTPTNIEGARLLLLLLSQMS